MLWNKQPAWGTILVAAGALLLVLSLELIRAQSAPSPPSPNQVPVVPSPVPAPSVAAPRPLVMIDPAHGGTESGAVLSPVILEKDITLALARRLRLDLASHGIWAELVRDSDRNLSTDDRAARANSEHPLLYICLHASSEIGGTRIFAAMLPEGEDTSAPFALWDRAQSASLPNSRSVQQQLVAAIQKSGLSARSLVAPLRPLNNVTSPAVAIEIAPTTANVAQLSSPEYEQNLTSALANGIAAVVAYALNTGVSK
jgi:N-acetylmuramoyl-L-alanine amidase